MAEKINQQQQYLSGVDYLKLYYFWPRDANCNAIVLTKIPKQTNKRSKGAAMKVF